MTARGHLRTESQRRSKNAIIRTMIGSSFKTAISGILTIICRRLIWRTRTSEARDRAWI